MLFFSTTIDGLQMGLCYAVLALGVYISYSILDFPDLSVDGTFPLGGVCCTIFMLKLGMPALPAVLLSFFAGLAAGALTGVLHVKFNISKLLSGIIVMTGLLSWRLQSLLPETVRRLRFFPIAANQLTVCSEALCLSRWELKLRIT